MSGSGDDYIDEEELERRAVVRAKAKEAAMKQAQQAKKGKGKGKATATVRQKEVRKSNKKKTPGQNKAKDQAKGGKEKDGGDAVFE
jgi:sRNA-binding protein